MKKQVIELWRTCFEDTEEFIRLYFERKYEDWTTVVFRKGKRIVAALQMLSYPMTCFGTQIETSYISGAATHPDFRNQGIMKKLLIEAFWRMNSRDIPVSILIPQEPWLFDFYRKMGYSSIFTFAWEHYTFAPEKAEIFSEEPPFDEAFAYFSQQMGMRPLCVQHPCGDFRTILDDLHLSGGRMICVRNEQGGINGMAFSLPAGNSVRINDLLADTEIEKHVLLSEVARQWGVQAIDCKVPSRDGTGMPGGMARIIQVQKILHTYASSDPEISFTLRLTDDCIPENSGYYLVTDGMCIKQQIPGDRVDFTMDVQTLAQKLFGQQAFISLMLD